MTGEQNLERAAGVADAEALERYLIYSAIHGGMTGT
jgi:hypothetical protein